MYRWRALFTENSVADTEVEKLIKNSLLNQLNKSRALGREYLKLKETQLEMYVPMPVLFDLICVAVVVIFVKLQ